MTLIPNAANLAADANGTLVMSGGKLRESPREDFLTAYRRVGEAPFQEALYAHAA